MEKPTRGLTPKWISQHQRFYEVCQAIALRCAAGQTMPIEWVEEYNELIEELSA
ncbi:MAG: hypothetical protein KAJ03_00245 [Gammaproteobacteria bacterium]|nr:hypothetical protein [Gammaproteobacteria bacterium]